MNTKMRRWFVLTLSVVMIGAFGCGDDSGHSKDGGHVDTPLPWPDLGGNAWNTTTPGSGGGTTPGGGAPPGATNGDDNTYPNGHPLSTDTTDTAILAVEDEILQLVNDHRVALGENALADHNGMRKTSRAHSKHMSGPDGGPSPHSFFAHDNPEGDSPGDRLAANNISHSGAGENIAAGYNNAQDAFQGWLNSPGHKANIENGAWTHTGIGYWEGGPYGKYYTQMFAVNPN